MSDSTIGWFAVAVVWISAGGALWCAVKADEWKGKYEDTCLDIKDLESQLHEVNERLHRSDRD